MKLIYYLCFLGFLTFIACKKEKIIQPSATPYWGEMSVNKNGVAWAALPVASLNLSAGYGLNIFFDSIDQFNVLQEEVGIYKVPYNPGTYPITYTAIGKNDSLIGAQFLYAQHDLVLGYYDVLTSDTTNYVTLLSYDSVSRELKGTFGITFIATHKPFANAPDTIRLRDGAFHTKVAK